MKEKRKFSGLIVILVIILIAGLGFGAYKIYNEIVTTKPSEDIIITFDLNGGTLEEVNLQLLDILDDGTITKKITNGSKTYGPLPSAEMESYDFLGWYTEREGGERVDYDTKLKSKESHTLYARFAPKNLYNYTVHYLNIENDEPLVTSEEKFTNRNTLVTAEIKDIIGYHIVESSSELSKFIDERDLSLTLYYEKNSYNLNFAVDLDGTLHTAEYTLTFDYGDTIYLPSFDDIVAEDENFNKNGYSFEKWEVNDNYYDNSAEITTDDLEDLGLSLLFSQDTTNSATLKANYVKNSYNLSFISQGEVFDSQNVLYLEIPNAVQEPSANGYTFAGWYANDTGATGTNIEGNALVNVANYRMPYMNKSIYAGFTLNQYDLTLNLDGGSYAGVDEIYTTTFTVEDNFFLETPIKDGYTFAGWTGDIYEQPIKEVKIQGQYRNITLNATYSAVEFTIVLNLDGGTIDGGSSIGYTSEDDDIVINKPQKDGYDFTGWTSTEITTPIKELIISSGSVGNKEFTANWEIINYDIVYNLDNGIIENGVNPISYNIESESFTLINPIKQGFDFVGWTKNEESEKQTSVTIENGTFGELTFTAHFEIEEYVILLNLNGGSYAGEVGENGVYTLSYTIQSNDIVLEDASKVGYDFTGWTGEGTTEATSGITISSGSTGDKEYTANYEIIDYVIDYELNGGVEVAGRSYPKEYNIESETFKPSALHKTGFIFVHWELYDENGDLLENVEEIVNGSIGDRKYVAIFVPDSRTPFTVEHYLQDLDGNYNVNADYTETQYGESETEVDAEISKTYAGFITPTVEKVTINADGSTIHKYYFERDSFTVQVEADANIQAVNDMTFKFEEAVSFTFVINIGYGFNGWTATASDDLQFTAGSDSVIVSFNMPASDVVVTASTVVASYLITLDYNDNDATPDKTEAYTYFDDDITIDNPTRLGYEFVGWTGTELENPTKNLVVVSGSTGNKDFTANWEIINYDIIYNLDGGVVDGENPESYNIETPTFTLINPTKEGYAFIGWSGSGIEEGSYENAITIEKGSISNLEFTANWSADAVVITVKHSYMNTDGVTYEVLETKTINTETGATITPALQEKEGFTAEQVAQSITITAESPKEITYKYTRNQYTITFEEIGNNIVSIKDNNGNNANDANIKYYYDTEITFTATLNTGYQIDAWNDLDENATLTSGDTLTITIPANNMRLEVVSSAIIYNISWELNDGTYASELKSTYTVEDLFTVGEPTKTGYVFDGWSETGVAGTTKTITVNAGTTGDKEFTANWSLDEYEISYQLDGGRFVAGATCPTTYDVTIATFTISSPVKDGYTFAGWSINSIDASITNSVTITQGETVSDLTLYAHWTANEYVVTLDYDGADGNFGDRTITLQYGSAYGTLPTPTRTGYEFVGWFLDDTFTSKIESTTTVTTAGPHTIYAYFVGSTHTLTFNKQGGNGGTDSAFVTYDADLPSGITAPTRAGYIFKGYYELIEGGGSCYYNESMLGQIKYMIDGDTEVHAYWQAQTYSVVLDDMQGHTTTINLTYNSDMPTGYTAPTKLGYSFAGYFSGKDGSGTQYYDSSMNSTNKWTNTSGATLYAHYTAVPFEVYLDARGGTLVNSTISVVYGGTYASLPTSVSKYGYNFAGWYDDSTTWDNQITTTSIVTNPNSHTLYAKWTAVNVTVTFDAKGGSVSPASRTYSYGDSYSSLPTPTRTGYTFDAWYLDEEFTSVVTSSTTITKEEAHSIYANWIADKYTLNYNTTENGGSNSISSVQVGYEQNIDLTPTGEKTGWTFVGWNTDSTAKTALTSMTMPLSNLTIYAIYKKDVTLTIYNNSTTATTSSGTMYNKETSVQVSIPASSSKSGWTSYGWATSTTADSTYYSTTTTASNLQISESLTLYAKYVRTLTINYNANNGSNAPSASTLKQYCVSTTSGLAYSSGAVTITSSEPSRNNYSFVGWSTSSSASSSSYNAGSTYTFSNTSTTISTTLYAVWEASAFTVSYNTTYNGGSGSVSNASVSAGSSVPLPTSGASKSGWTFEGWNTDRTATSGLSSLTMPSSDVTLYAIYSKELYYYIYNNSSSSTTISTTIYNNATSGTVTFPAMPSKSYWTKVGWSSDDDLDDYTSNGPSGWSTSSFTTSISTSTSGTTYYSKYERTLTLSYSANGGSNAPSSTEKTQYYNGYAGYSSRAVTVTSSEPTYTGYTFVGWSTSSSASSATYTGGDSYNFSNTGTKSKTLYAVWEVSGYTLTIKVTGEALSDYTENSEGFSGVYYNYGGASWEESDDPILETVLVDEATKISTTMSSTTISGSVTITGIQAGEVYYLYTSYFFNDYDFAYETSGTPSSSTSSITVDRETVTDDGTFEIWSIIVNGSGTVTVEYWNNVACFTGDTDVKTENGTVNIESVKAGDKVYSYNESTNEIELKEVLEVKVYDKITTIYNIKVGEETIRATGDHPILTANGYVMVNRLKVGDKLLTSSGEVEITEITTETLETTVYDLIVADNNTYLVGNNEIIVKSSHSLEKYLSENISSEEN
ncbi:MAG: InlB B-repeat-containing protein [Clostridia bacterium]|nr:InlB B-repeat-containing protein [Clostridia bacterium]